MYDNRNLIETKSSNNFESLENIYNNIHTVLFEFNYNEEDDFHAFIKRNSRYVFLRQINDTESELVNITDVYENRFANKDFIFLIGDDVIDVRKDITENEIDYNSSHMMCGDKIQVEHVNNFPGCKRDRKADIKLRCRRGPGSSNRCIPQITARLKGQRKRLCIWIDYSTGLNYIGTPAAAGTWRNSDGTSTNYSTTSNFLGFIGPTSCVDCFRLELVTTTLSTIAPIITCGGSEFFTSASVTGSTRGIGTATLTASCN